MATKKPLSTTENQALLEILQTRFEKNMQRHKGLEWNTVQSRLSANSDKIWSLQEMEDTGGEPDVVGFDDQTGEYIFMDCAAESPAGRRSLCYDREALTARKKFKPENSALDLAREMGAEILDEIEYRALQKLGTFDQKTSSWLKTPSAIRKHGGAIFGDYRYGNIFIYHNGADSYYAARGFRASLRV